MDAILYNKIEQEANRIINAYMGNITTGAKVGLYTPTEDLTTITITHDFGVIPKMAFIIGVPNKNAWVDVPGAMILYEALGTNPETGDFKNEYGNNKKIASGTIFGTDIFYALTPYTTYPVSMTDTDVTFVTGRYYNGRFKAGYTYIYVLIK
ncbi:MAG: hypothetical protein U0M02_03025 [Acutalibacteraceae bacterium]|nr:hypothetical protein [Acutalibacteraceae bacterium]